MNEEFRIPKIPVPVVCLTLEREEIAGEIFVDVILTEGYSVEQVVDFFNHTSFFFPLRVPGKMPPVLIRRDSIVRVNIPDLTATFISGVPEFAARKDASFHTRSWGLLTGSVVLDVPEEHARVLDLMNYGECFFPALIDDSLTLLNARHIYKIEEQ